MVEMKFRAYALTNEIDLNKIAVECGIKKKYTWEEPLILQGDQLVRILEQDAGVRERVLVFSFGAVVFIDSDEKHRVKFLDYLKKIKNDIDLNQAVRYQEDYMLHGGEEGKLEFNDRYVRIPNLEKYHPELVSMIIAKSVALERIEEKLGKILDDLEFKIDSLEKGRLGIGNRELARTTSRIVRHEYNTIAYVMILDKPDITWTNSEAAAFYEGMSEFFELNDRYEVIRSKTEILRNIIEGLSSISHSIRGLFVEWVIVVLIVFEVVLMILDLFR